MRSGTGGTRRGQSQAIGVLLMVAVALIAGSTAFVYLGDIGSGVTEPSFAAVSTAERLVDFGDDSECPGPRETAVDVSLVRVQDADEVYVRVSDEGGERKKVLWANPSAATGTTKTLANEVESDPRVDVDIGGGGDWAYCPGDEATFEFYAVNDGQTQLLQRITIGD